MFRLWGFFGFLFLVCCWSHCHWMQAVLVLTVILLYQPLKWWIPSCAATLFINVFLNTWLFKSLIGLLLTTVKILEWSDNVNKWKFVFLVLIIFYVYTFGMNSSFFPKKKSFFTFFPLLLEVKLWTFQLHLTCMYVCVYVYIHVCVCSNTELYLQPFIDFLNIFFYYFLYLNYCFGFFCPFSLFLVSNLTRIM